MAGIYDRLRDQLGDEDDRPHTLTALDIADLPADQRRVMFALLRDAQAATEGVTEDDLAQRFGDMPELVAVVAELSRRGWLIQRGEPPRVRYKVTMRRRGREAGLGPSVWTLLMDRLDLDAPTDEDGDQLFDSPHPGAPDMSDW